MRNRWSLRSASHPAGRKGGACRGPRWGPRSGWQE